jgi:hypothetical protein
MHPFLVATTDMVVIIELYLFLSGLHFICIASDAGLYKREKVDGCVSTWTNFVNICSPSPNLKRRLPSGSYEEELTP